MRLRFWMWAHDAAESLWHWIYYNHIPEGIEERKRRDAIYSEVNKAYRKYWMTWVNSKGEPVKPPEL